MKRSELRRYTPLKSKAGIGKKKPKSGSKKKTLPTWIKAIPEGSHGSGTLQKRLWRLVSDFVRIRDWTLFGKRCTATGKCLESWKHGQAGHFRPYTKCNGMMKFDESNIFLQSAQSNGFGDYDDWKQFEAEIIRRYGEDHIPNFLSENIRHVNEKIYDSMVIEKMEAMLGKMEVFDEKPEYYERVMTLLAHYKEKLYELQTND